MTGSHVRRNYHHRHMPWIADEEIDAYIIQRCNELIALKQETAQKRSEFYNETTQLQQQLDRTLSIWRQRLQDDRHTSNKLYQDVIQGVFGEDLPKRYALKKQAELCRTLHHMILRETQLRIMAQQNKELVQFFETKLDEMYDHDDDDIRRLRSNIRDLENDFSQHNHVLRADERSHNEEPMERPPEQS